jgi:hypothetical protein
MKITLSAVLLILLCCALRAQGQDPPDSSQDQPDQTAVRTAIGQLGSVDPLIRERGAEELARLAPVDQIHLVEGYRLQEKDKGVRLALDWALYRMGQPERLYAVVNELNGRINAQAAGYLGQVDDPSALYPFLNSVAGKTLVGVLTALGATGNAETLTKIRIFKSNFDPLVSRAASDAEASIQQRLAQAPVTPGNRDRVVTPPGDDHP